MDHSCPAQTSVSSCARTATRMLSPHVAIRALMRGASPGCRNSRQRHRFLLVPFERIGTLYTIFQIHRLISFDFACVPSFHVADALIDEPLSCNLTVPTDCKQPNPARFTSRPALHPSLHTCLLAQQYRKLRHRSYHGFHGFMRSRLPTLRSICIKRLA
jgi:hypothetical protein